MKSYVLGFAYNSERTQVLLIHKQHGPQSIVGKLNGLGGKMEPGETPEQAMVREFREECGIETITSDWQQFAVMNGSSWSCRVFRTFGVDLSQHETLTDETVGIGLVDFLPPLMLGSARALIALGLSDGLKVARIEFR